VTKLLPGVVASGISGNLFAPSGAYDSIATVTPYTTTTTVVFNSIPSTYTHLQIRVSSNYGTGAANNGFWVQFNGDTAANYFWHQLYGNGTTVASGAAATRNEIYCGVLAGTSSSYAGAAVIDILDYASVNKNKTVRSLTGSDLNGSGFVKLMSGAWANSSTAVSSITITTDSTFGSNSSFALYGIKGGN
jgi:hypothetical protein